MSHSEEEINQDMARSFEVARPMFLELERVAGYSPPKELVLPFSRLHKVLLENEPRCLVHLRQSEPGRVDWIKRLRSAILNSLQEGLCATSYHLSKIEAMELDMLHIAETYVPKLGVSPTSSAMAGGNSRGLNFEYQAFAFALRRSLEYLGVAVAAYFKADCHSIRALLKSIEGAAPLERAQAIRVIYGHHTETLQDVIPKDKDVKRSLRDRLAHWEAVGAGCFNLSRTPFGYSIGIFGGGHDLKVTQQRNFIQNPESNNNLDVRFESLGPVLRNQFERVNAFVWACMHGLGLNEAE